MNENKKLRPLSDMTEDEAKHIYINIFGNSEIEPIDPEDPDEWENYLYRVTKSEGCEVWGTYLDVYIGRPELWKYLISRGFDLK